MTYILSKLPYYLNRKASWVYNGNEFHRGLGGGGTNIKCVTRLLLSMRKGLIEYINKGGDHTKYIYDLQYMNL